MSLRWLLAAACACGTQAHPTPTGATCTDPSLTYASFGRAFMDKYCINCHHHCLKISQRNGAPLFHDFDYAEGATGPWDHIDQQAGWGPKAHNDFMPGYGTGGQCPSQLGGALDEPCPEPTDEERTQLATWMACEHAAGRDYGDAGLVDCN